MTPAATKSAETIQQLRQQLILAQVRIMELEDLSAQLTPRLEEVEALLTAAQQLADTKLDEVAHLTKVLTDTQARAGELQAQLEQSAAGLTDAREQLTRTQQSAARTAETQVETVQALESARTRLDTELEEIRSSRSWRWTAWLRALEKSFTRRQS